MYLQAHRSISQLILGVKVLQTTACVLMRLKHMEGDAVLDAAIPESGPDPLQDGPHSAVENTLHRITELVRLGRTSKIIKSNRSLTIVP